MLPLPHFALQVLANRMLLTPSEMIIYRSQTTSPGTLTAIEGVAALCHSDVALDLHATRFMKHIS